MATKDLPMTEDRNYFTKQILELLDRADAGEDIDEELLRLRRQAVVTLTWSDYEGIKEDMRDVWLEAQSVLRKKTERAIEVHFMNGERPIVWSYEGIFDSLTQRFEKAEQKVKEAQAYLMQLGYADEEEQRVNQMRFFMEAIAEAHEAVSGVDPKEMDYALVCGINPPTPTVDRLGW